MLNVQTSRSKGFKAETSGNVAMMFGLSLFPLMLMVGAAVDYGRATTVKAQINNAADAAALSAIAQSLNNNLAPPDGNMVREYFRASNPTATDIDLSSINVSSTTSATSVFTTVTYTARVPNTFMKMIGFDYTTLNGSVTAMADKPKYVDFYLMLDNSPSMGLGASASDIAKLQSVTPDSCAFACHQHTFDAAGKITGNSTTDYYTIAKNNGVKTRIDVLRDATKNIAQAAFNAKQIANQFRMGVYTFSDTFQIIAPPTANLTTGTPSILTMADNIDLAFAYRDQRDTQTSYETALARMNQTLPNPGDGSTALTPSSFLFIVTDGVQDQPVGTASGAGDVQDQIALGSTYIPPAVTTLPNIATSTPGNVNSKRQIGTLNAALCDTIKARNIRIAVLYTPYLPVTNNGFYNSWVAPIAPQIPTKLSQCASPGFYFEVTPTQGINEAMMAMFRAALSKARLSS